MQITKAFVWILAVEHRFPIAIAETYNDINKYLDKADYIVVSTAGNVLVDIAHIRKKIINIPEDVGILGHLLQYKDNLTPWLHEQFFIINTKAVKKVDLHLGVSTDTGTELIRSKEDMHGGWAPLAVTLGDKHVTRELRFGTTLIEQCLRNGFQVRNFDESWRQSSTSNDYVNLDNALPTRGFCYPCENTEVFEKSLKELVVYPGLNEAQEMIISTLKKVLAFKVLNVWNNDTIPKGISAKKVITPANGFLGELSLLATGASTIVFYDKNLNNLEFKKYLYNHWDGVDYELLASNWARLKNLAVEPVFDVDKDKCKKWVEIVNETMFVDWHQWKKGITVKFIYGDIVSDPELILNEISDNTFLHTSTILSIFPFTAFVHDEETISNTRKIIDFKISNTNSVWIET